MAFQAQQVDLRPLEQARIGRTVRRVAGDAAFRLHRFVLESEWACLVSMALEANLVLGGGGTQLLGQEAAVLVMTIGALHQPLVDAMPEGTGKVLLDLGVAAVAKLRLLLDQQELR